MSSWFECCILMTRMCESLLYWALLLFTTPGFFHPCQTKVFSGSQRNTHTHSLTHTRSHRRAPPPIYRKHAPYIFVITALLFYELVESFGVSFRKTNHRGCSCLCWCKTTHNRCINALHGENAADYHRIKVSVHCQTKGIGMGEIFHRSYLCAYKPHNRFRAFELFLHSFSKNVCRTVQPKVRKQQQQQKHLAVV